jgi:hypothetical protein
MNRFLTGCLLALLAAIASPAWESQGKADEPAKPAAASTGQASAPEKLMTVVLKCDQAFKVIPFMSVGVDVVNSGGKSKNSRSEATRMSFDYLPGGVVSLEGPQVGTLWLQPEDDGKNLQLKVDGPVLYKNDTPCWITFEGTIDPGENPKSKVPAQKKKNENIETAKKRFSQCMSAIDLAKKRGQTKELLVNIPPGDASLRVLRALRGSGAGIAYTSDQPADKGIRGALSKDFVQAVDEVEPRMLIINCRRFAELKDRLAKLEGLFLVFDPGDSLPDLTDLTPLKKLRMLNLLFFNQSSPSGDGNMRIDLKGLENMKQLKALTVFGPKVENGDILNSLSGLQFLVMASDSELPAALSNLRDMRHLAGTFPFATDFSFAERMPHLQTLCIFNVNEQHNLKPLENAHRLRCLAVPNSTITGSIGELQKARPDVDVVEYIGMCLGSFWLLPAAGLAAFAAWLMRRRFHRGRGFA